MMFTTYVKWAKAPDEGFIEDGPWMEGTSCREAAELRAQRLSQPSDAVAIIATGGGRVSRARVFTVRATPPGKGYELVEL